MLRPIPGLFSCPGDDRPPQPGEWPSPLGVMLEPDGMPRGQAFEAGATAGGVALWRLVVRGAEVPGRFVLRGRRFEPAG